MRIGGVQRFSLSDYPGKIAVVVFTQGCNFRCPFCHNGSLIPAKSDSLIPEEDVLAFLRKRAGLCNGVVISGGEPTLQQDLADFIVRLKEIGLAVKLDTNGSRPSVLKSILKDKIIDFIAMDVKAPLSKYHKLAGIFVKTERIMESIHLIAKSKVDHLFRTTVVPSLLTSDDIREIRKLIPPESPYRLQTFRPENALDPRLRVSQIIPES